MNIKGIVDDILAFLKRIKGWWRIIYIGFAILVYIHFGGLIGAIVMTAALILCDALIHKLD